MELRKQDNISRLQEYAQIKKYKLLTYKIEVIKTVFPNKVNVTCICPEISEKVCEIVMIIWKHDTSILYTQESAGEMLKCKNQGKIKKVEDVKVMKEAKNVQ